MGFEKGHTGNDVITAMIYIEEKMGSLFISWLAIAMRRPQFQNDVENELFEI